VKWLAAISGLAVLVGMVSYWPLAAAGGGIEARPVIRETLLARLPPGTLQATASPDGKRVAHVLRQGSQSSVVVDGRAQGRYDAVRGLVFSPDSRRLAFAAKRRGKWRMVADGIEGKAYDGVCNPRFSPDSRRLVFEVSRGGTIEQSSPWWEVDRKKGRAGRCRLVVNGVEGRVYDWIDYWGAAFTDKGVAYRARRGQKHLVVVNGQAGTGFDWIWGPYLSPDGRRVAYAGSQREGADPRFFVVVDGVRSGPYSFIGKVFFAFSPDSKHYAYLAYHGGELVLAADGREQVVGAHLHENFAYVGFSRDGRHLAYSARSSTSGRWAIVLDGREDKEHDGVAFESPRFSPDSERFAYVADRDGQSLAVVDHEEGKRYDSIVADSLLFSPDSSHLAYIAGRAGEQFVVVDRAEGSAYDSILKDSLLYSPDSEHLAYVALRDGRRFVVLDGRRGSGYERVLGPVFSPDGRHLAYAASAGGVMVIVVDEVPVTLRRSILPSFARLAFDGRSRFHTLAQRGHELLRVEVEIAQQ